MVIRMSDLFSWIRFALIFLVSLIAYDSVSVLRWVLILVCVFGIDLLSGWISAAKTLRNVSHWLTEELNKAKDTLETKVET